jgi:RES domain
VSSYDYSFEEHGSPPRYGTGRFGDGSTPVFYSALAEETCRAEVAHHLNDKVALAPFPRFYHLLECDFTGIVIDLHGKEIEHPELISPTDDGYPFCQAVAKDARNTGAHALHTPSARHRSGTCAPVFARSNLSRERAVARAMLVPENGALKYERLTL